ncbi:hypothetical protein LY78DRAFT_684949 [Colletotrichum sublineola]|nr:hypothetical protein LY78DRAFT_684949 [Colletotrichum sublineola]
MADQDDGNGNEYDRAFRKPWNLKARGLPTPRLNSDNNSNNQRDRASSASATAPRKTKNHSTRGPCLRQTQRPRRRRNSPGVRTWTGTTVDIARCLWSDVCRGAALAWGFLQAAARALWKDVRAVFRLVCWLVGAVLWAVWALVLSWPVKVLLKVVFVSACLGIVLLCFFEYCLWMYWSVFDAAREWVGDMDFETCMHYVSRIPIGEARSKDVQPKSVDIVWEVLLDEMGHHYPEAMHTGGLTGAAVWSGLWDEIDSVFSFVKDQNALFQAWNRDGTGRRQASDETIKAPAGLWGRVLMVLGAVDDVEEIRKRLARARLGEFGKMVAKAQGSRQSIHETVLTCWILQ